MPIELFDLSSTEGTISCTLTEMEFSDPFPTIKGSGGVMNLDIYGLQYLTSIAWDIRNVGGINLDVKDNFQFSNESRTHTFDIEDETGDVRVLVDLYPDYGLRVETSRLGDEEERQLGVVTIPGGGDTFTSNNFDSANIKYDFDISVWYSDITFVR